MAKLTYDDFNETQAAQLRRELEVCRPLAASLQNRWLFAKLNKITFIAPREVEADFRKLTKFISHTRKIRKACISPFRKSIYESALPVYREYVKYCLHRPRRKIHIISIPMGDSRDSA